MSAITRRIFLRNSTAAGVALVTVAAPVVAEATQTEHPDLLRVGAEIDGAMAAVTIAMTNRMAARARFNEIAPALPDALICHDRNGHFLTEREMDCEGNHVWPEGKPVRPPRRIYSADAIGRGWMSRGQARKTRAGKLFAHIRKVAEKYETEHAAAAEASGIMSALGELHAAVDDVRRLASLASRTTPNSLTGLVIKAKVMECYATCGGEERQWVANYAATLPADIMALFVKAVQS